MTSFNCRGIKSVVEEVKQLCKTCDIILLQETWLYSHELSFIMSISNDYYGTAISLIDSQNGVKGRHHGRLAILWHKDLAGTCLRLWIMKMTNF